MQIKENPTSSPDFDKTYVVQRGDTLSGIAFAVYRDATVWRAHRRTTTRSRTRARCTPGQVLQIPSLT